MRGAVRHAEGTGPGSRLPRVIATTVCDDGGPLPRAAVANVLSLLLRRVTLSGVFVLALVLVWAAVLLPSLLRRHDVALARSAERLSSAVRVLQRPPRRPSPGPGPGAAAAPVDLPERVDASAVPADGVPSRPVPDTVPPAVPAAAPGTEPAGEPVRGPKRAPVLAPAARAARRRRRVLVGLLLVTALGVVAGLVAGTAGWVLAGTGGAVLALFLAAAARAVRASGGTAAGHGAAAAAAPAVAERRADVPAPRQAGPRLFDQELFDQGSVGPRAAGVPECGPETVRDPLGGPAADRQPHSGEPVPAEPAVGPGRRRRRPLVAADGTWTPVPVPTPVYLTAPRVPYPSTPRRPVPAARPARQPQVVRQRTAAGLGIRRAVGS